MCCVQISKCVCVYIYTYIIIIFVFLILIYLQKSTAFDALLIKGAFFVSHLFEQKRGTPIQFEEKSGPSFVRIFSLLVSP